MSASHIRGWRFVNVDALRAVLYLSPSIAEDDPAYLFTKETLLLPQLLGDCLVLDVVQEECRVAH